MDMSAIFITLVCTHLGACPQGDEFTALTYVSALTCSDAPMVPQGFIATNYPGYSIKRIECGKYPSDKGYPYDQEK